MGNLLELLPVDGIRLAAGSAGIYGKPRDDLALFEICDGAGTSAVFTRNRFCAAPVTVARDHLKRGPARYFLVNAGNANAGTGARGVDDAMQVCAALADRAGCAPEAVLPFSTGVIGEYLPVDNICRALPGLVGNLADDAWPDCARAVMTTDTRPKGCSVQFAVGEETVTVTGIAKGAGMIKPDMATMLAFVATDAAVSQGALDRMLKTAADQSFNRICVDGDTSTNDACVLIATGKRAAAYEQLEAIVTEVCIELAREIVRDAEGATKFVTIRVENAGSEAECAAIAEAVSTSPLVKTALFASDPNWGRILAAVGRSGTGELDINRVSLYLDDVCVVRNGTRAGDYTEEKGTAAMQKDEIGIRIDLNKGNASACYWTCDLSHDYVTINAEYRT
ncbi:MAG: bifunctional glutamate N-acetyltransferase/amino-acid acetyltransferase ArgJ [Gammaproteobacteria bacterium]|nr:bifunctional glutamate N-acetyltransferase/amino-acid acetyltransferase ArgJ [Gammaproteobacteria bacterium]